MQETSSDKGTDAASATTGSAPQIIYRAFMDPEAVAVWRAPKGMRCHIYEFNPQVGGTFILHPSTLTTL